MNSETRREGTFFLIVGHLSLALIIGIILHMHLDKEYHVKDFTEIVGTGELSIIPESEINLIAVSCDQFSLVPDGNWTLAIQSSEVSPANISVGWQCGKQYRIDTRLDVNEWLITATIESNHVMETHLRFFSTNGIEQKVVLRPDHTELYVLGGAGLTIYLLAWFLFYKVFFN